MRDNATKAGDTLETLARDTSPAAERIQIERWREMTATEKLRIASELTQAVRELSLAGIRLRHPEASERECAWQLAVLTLGPDLAARAYSHERTLTLRER